MCRQQRPSQGFFVFQTRPHLIACCSILRVTLKMVVGTELVLATISHRNQRDVSPLRLRSHGLHHGCRVCCTAATRRRRGGIVDRDGGAGEHVVRRRDRRHRVSRVERQRLCLHALWTSPPYGLVSHPPTLSAMWQVK